MEVIKHHLRYNAKMELLSRTKIDQLGDRLRKGNITGADLQLLDEYRRSFNETYDEVVNTLRNRLELEPTGRPAKSTSSITEKLRRESIRLTQMQDVAGCRIVVPDLAEQERVVETLSALFSQATIVDRRQKPSHGYRAVHVIVVLNKRGVEIQIRTVLQQRWAELSEKISDLLDPAIKYGGGAGTVQALLLEISADNAKLEDRENILLKVQRMLDERMAEPVLTEDERTAIMELQRKADSIRARLVTERETVLQAFRDAVDKLQE